MSRQEADIHRDVVVPLPVLSSSFHPLHIAILRDHWEDNLSEAVSELHPWTLGGWDGSTRIVLRHAEVVDHATNRSNHPG